MMYQTKLTLGVLPNKRGMLSMAEAKRQKDLFMRVIAGIHSDIVTLVDIEGLCENGIASHPAQAPAIIERFTTAGIDALFLPFCDFGTESVVAAVAAACKVPTLVWGARDEVPNTNAGRGRDTQCGMFAATKVLRRYGVQYSYIYNVPAESDEFRLGFDRFIRAAVVLKDLRELKIAKIGERPDAFMSVMTNEAALLNRFGITSVPVPPIQIEAAAQELLTKRPPEFLDYFADFTTRIDCSLMELAQVEKLAAVKMAIRQLMEQKGCTVGAIECWPSCERIFGVPVCAAIGELADEGLPIACETDLNGAVTMAILRGCLLGKEPAFLADLTIRNPQNDNSELLWHCGPFAYSLKSPESKARLVDRRECWELKQGNLTVCRFDDIDGEYYLFAGEGHTTTGPETTGTYIWFEVDDWKRWEEKLMFGPYIHHLGGCYGTFEPVLREVARYLGLRYDPAETPGGPRCLS